MSFCLQTFFFQCYSSRKRKICLWVFIYHGIFFQVPSKFQCVIRIFKTIIFNFKVFSTMLMPLNLFVNDMKYYWCVLLSRVSPIAGYLDQEIFSMHRVHIMDSNWGIFSISLDLGIFCLNFKLLGKVNFCSLGCALGIGIRFMPSIPP